VEAATGITRAVGALSPSGFSSILVAVRIRKMLPRQPEAGVPNRLVFASLPADLRTCVPARYAGRHDTTSSPSIWEERATKVRKTSARPGFSMSR